MHAYILTYIHTYIHTYVHTYIHTYMHTYNTTYMHTYIHACMHTYKNTYIHAYRQRSIRTYAHTIHKYLHTYTHTYTCMHNAYLLIHVLKTYCIHTYIYNTITLPLANFITSIGWVALCVVNFVIESAQTHHCMAISGHWFTYTLTTLCCILCFVHSLFHDRTMALPIYLGSYYLFYQLMVVQVLSITQRFYHDSIEAKAGIKYACYSVPLIAAFAAPMIFMQNKIFKRKLRLLFYKTLQDNPDVLNNNNSPALTQDTQQDSESEEESEEDSSVKQRVTRSQSRESNKSKTKQKQDSGNETTTSSNNFSRSNSSVSNNAQFPCKANVLDDFSAEFDVELSVMEGMYMYEFK